MQVTEATTTRGTTTTTADTKVLLLDHIQKTPGIRYRELLRLTGLINGVLSYHLAVLEKAKVIKAQRVSDNKILSSRYIR